MSDLQKIWDHVLWEAFCDGSARLKETKKKKKIEDYSSTGPHVRKTNTKMKKAINLPSSVFNSRISLVLLPTNNLSEGDENEGGLKKGTENPSIYES
mmetsp:Transcript_35509/g.40334  ORF Transcript_35509/g.40334 Transcript_35509/m.40334 type:complete len:97 (+) Transcript_35509:49-339(+)